MCDLIGGEDVIASLRAGGGTAAEYQRAAVEASDDVFQSHSLGGGAISPTDYTNLWNTGVAGTGHFRRIAGTVQLKSGESVWTVNLNMLADSRTAGSERCFGYGTAVPGS